MNELDYAFATQKIDRLGNKVFSGDKQILVYVGGKLWNVPRLETRINKGEIILDEDQRIIEINNHEDLGRMGFIIVNEKLDPDQIYYRGQKRILKLKRISKNVEMPKIPDGHYVEYSVVNKALRLVGKDSGPYGKGPTIPLKRKEKIAENDYEDILSSFCSVDNESEKEVTIEKISIPEIPVMITEEGELACLPNEQDEPTVGVIGIRGTGKSLFMHGLSDRGYHKWNRKVVVLNDYMNECHTWALPWVYLTSNFANSSMPTSFAKELAKIGEATMPLPCVYLTPVTSSLIDIGLKDSGVSYLMSIPFKDIINNFQYYLKEKKEWKMGPTGRYFRKMAEDLISCKTIEEIETAVRTNLPGKGDAGVRNKIISVMEDIFDRKFLDVNTGVKSKWTVQMKDGHVGKYSPILATMLVGGVPVLQTNDISAKDYFPQYYRYIIQDIFKKQTTDEYFIKNQIKTWLFIDELQSVSSTSKPGPASEVLDKWVAEGRNARGGFFYATQNYSKVTLRVRSNTKYLFCFKLNSSDEINAIAADRDLTLIQKKKIKRLKKFEMLAITSERFVCYDADGNRRYTDEGEILKGRSLPPLSMHKAPSSKQGEEA